MYKRSDASKLIIHYKSWLETKISGASVIRHRSSDQFVEEYWPTGKEADIHYNNSQE
ncbi:hypothetical protein MMU07_14665 [Aquiflexum sp. LQ15W]|uniref:hypothetical protein n=1 Tax=Cognataquiflexum nitidum TaxID=2922272 RepID=UPI001F148424|nr:hypothetical protein [Cognataquiflexum nitidum]MCH6200824.1 hypothetical protein [Cognataquiflexum nitidum]